MKEESGPITKRKNGRNIKMNGKEKNAGNEKSEGKINIGNEKSTGNTKERILEATLKLAATDGLGSVSLSQIASTVGIQKQSLYNHFTSKAELIDELYEYLRNKAKSKVYATIVDYGAFVKGKQPLEILTMVVQNYRTMNQDKDMEQFYRFIMSERSIHKEAAKIMIAETNRMILTTKQLFYAMQVQHVMEFKNVDMAAFTFANMIHSIMDYMGDQRIAEMEENSEHLLEEYLKDFCEVYAK